MSRLRQTVFALVTSIIIFSTAYSVLYDTYLDTSNPLLSNLPHPLSQSHYFANKSNILNVYFIKKAWGWTSLVFFLSCITSPQPARRKERFIKWAVETSVWAVFTAWFFGPSLLDRLIVASGGGCVVNLPNGALLDVPPEVCFSRTPLSPGSHPQYFAEISNFATPLPMDWKTLPRLRRGHDVSGHIFLLTMSVLFLTDQLQYSFQARGWSILHKFAFSLNLAFIGIWLLAIGTTSVYFHSPLEKITGYVLGVAGFSLTQLPITKMISSGNNVPAKIASSEKNPPYPSMSSVQSKSNGPRHIDEAKDL